jgi:hypothetical protein
VRRLALLFLAMSTTTALAADRIVVATATAGFRHDSIETAEMVIEQIAARTGWFEPVFARTEEEMAEALSPQTLESVTADDYRVRSSLTQKSVQGVSVPLLRQE